MFIAKLPSGQTSSEGDINSRTKYMSNNNGDVFAQFVPGYVVDVVTSKDHWLYKEMSSELFINSIKAVQHIGATKSAKVVEQAQAEIFFQLLRGIADVPTRGDQVLLCNFGGINYYLGPLNTVNSPNFNPDLELSMDGGDGDVGNRDATGISPGMIWNDAVKRLEKRPNEIDTEGITGADSHTAADFSVGDMIFEGRHGNSIRLGQRSTHPYIVISNGRDVARNVETHHDNTFISITSKGKLLDWHYSDLMGRGDVVDKIPDFLPASNQDEKNERQLEWEDTDIGQVLISSQKITFNSKIDKFTISSRSDVNIGSADNLKIYTKNSTIIESKNIYLGEESIKNKSGQSGGEPLVLGDELRKMLLGIVRTLMSLKTTANSPAMSGPPDPNTIRTLADYYQQLSIPQATPFLSTLHFMEKNKTKK